jgi:hypothetical protein
MPDTRWSCSRKSHTGILTLSSVEQVELDDFLAKPRCLSDHTGTLPFPVREFLTQPLLVRTCLQSGPMHIAHQYDYPFERQFSPMTNDISQNHVTHLPELFRRTFNITQREPERSVSRLANLRL